VGAKYPRRVRLGELSLIEKLREMIGPPGPGTMLGLGDDAAVLEPPAGLSLLTCDAFVEGVHFRRQYASLRDIGWKCMVANLSDVAAMGGFPAQGVVSVCVGESTSEDDVVALYSGMLEAAKRYGAEIVGGDVVSSQSGLMVSIALLGTADPERVVTRRGAVPGDALVVTGELGGSQAGLEALEAGLPVEGAVLEAVRRHLTPVPRIAEAQALIDVATPHAMIDLSDGLSTDALHLAEESHAAILVRKEDVPVSSSATEVARRLGRDPAELALRSGEEFELLVALPASEVERSIEHVGAVTGTRLTLIGEVMEKRRGSVLASSGGEEPLRRTGYEHALGRDR
jgi:thiamine-monophosphate kinase